MDEKPKNLFERAIRNLEEKTGKPFIKHLADESAGIEQRAEEYEKQGIKDVIPLDASSFQKLITTGRLREEGRGLTGHPRLGQTDIGDVVVVVGYDDKDEKFERRARVVSLTRPHKKDYRVNWEIELIEE